MLRIPPSLCEEAVDLSGVAAASLPMSGMLVKKGQRRKNWKVRYFYMLGGSLQYYEHEHGEPLGAAIVIGVYDIPDRPCSRSLFAPAKLALNRFDIVCIPNAEEPADLEDGSLREERGAALDALQQRYAAAGTPPATLSVYAMTSQDKARWIDALQRCSRRLPLSSHPRLAAFHAAHPDAIGEALVREDRLQSAAASHLLRSRGTNGEQNLVSEGRIIKRGLLGKKKGLRGWCERGVELRFGRLLYVADYTQIDAADRASGRPRGKSFRTVKFEQVFKDMNRDVVEIGIVEEEEQGVAQGCREGAWECTRIDRDADAAFGVLTSLLRELDATRRCGGHGGHATSFKTTTRPPSHSNCWPGLAEEQTLAFASKILASAGTRTQSAGNTHDAVNFLFAGRGTGPEVQEVHVIPADIADTIPIRIRISSFSPVSGIRVEVACTSFFQLCDDSRECLALVRANYTQSFLLEDASVSSVTGPGVVTVEILSHKLSKIM